MSAGRILYGGSFDPPTLAHRHLIDIALAAVPETPLIVIPAGQPPHKRGQRQTAARMRLALARLAFAAIPRVEVSSEEVDRDAVSWTWETLARHRAELGPGARLYWLIGGDSLLDLPTWREPGRILELATVLTVARPGFDLSRLDALEGLTRAQKDALRAGILAGEGPAISATAVRRRLARQEDVSDCVEARVLDFIGDQQLYVEGPC